jgi:hypothetical protein
MISTLQMQLAGIQRVAEQAADALDGIDVDDMGHLIAARGMVALEDLHARLREVAEDLTTAAEQCPGHSDGTEKHTRTSDSFFGRRFRY